MNDVKKHSILTGRISNNTLSTQQISAHINDRKVNLNELSSKFFNFVDTERNQ